MNLGYLLENAFHRFKERPAVSDGKRTFSFALVRERIHRLGSALIDLGIAPQARIASLQYNSIETFEFDLMAARFGFCRTLLNARSGIADYLDILGDCETTVLVFGAEFADTVAALRPQLPKLEFFVCVGDGPEWALNYEELIARTQPREPQYEPEEADLHSIYYTSGTTGKPKGVVLSQRNWLVVVRNHLIDVFPRAGPDDVLLHAAPMSHHTGSLIFSHLVRGARQHVQRRFDAEETLDLFASAGVTTVFLAPTMIIKVLEQHTGGGSDKWRLHTVRYGAAPMAADRIREAMDVLGPVLVQGFGQWESPQVMTILDQRQHLDAIASGKLHRLQSCGLAMSHVRMGVMDDAGNLLGPDEEGEVVTAGDHLMVGYLKRPAETAALRVGPWQRTGDVGRIDADGFIYLTDRKRDLIITGGNNVYPRQIEETLYAHPDILEAVAIGIPHDTYGEVVHAVVVARSGHTLDAEQFLAWCRARLPTDKRPRSVEVVADLPKNAYGKVLRREVREPYWKGRARRI